MPCGILPEYACKALRTQYGIDRIFQHEKPVADADSQRSPRVSFSGHYGDHRYVISGHLSHISGNGLSLAVFLSINAGVGSGSIDKSNDGPFELLGLVHYAESLPVALRLCHAEIIGHVLLCRVAFPVAHNAYGYAVESGDAAVDRRVVIIEMIPLLLKKVGEKSFDKIIDVGPLYLSCKENLVLCSKVDTGP